MDHSAQARALGRRKNDPEGLRGRILDAAFELFQIKGYNGTSIQDIAASAGVTGGALHHHFASKKSLGLAVISLRVAPAVRETWIEPVLSAPNARDGIVEVFQRLADELDGQGFVRGCPVNNLTLELAFADEEFRAQLRPLFDDWRAAVARKFSEQGTPDPDGLALVIVAGYSGAMTIAKLEQRGEPLRGFSERLSRSLKEFGQFG